ncbi:MAG: TAXI family TRAP transporter solute-binding subunit [Pseudomonadota bacterium]
MKWRCLQILFYVFIGFNCTLAHAQSWQDFKIATGPPTSSSYLLGTFLTASLSRPLGDRACEDVGACGVEGLIAVARAKPDYYAALDDLHKGRADMVVITSNIAWWTFYGLEIFADKQMRDLRLVLPARARQFHLISRDKKFRSFQDIKHASVAAGHAQSSVRHEFYNILEKSKISPDDLDLVALEQGAAIDGLNNGDVDLAVLFESAPSALLTDSLDNIKYHFVRMDAKLIRALAAHFPYLNRGRIESGLYGLDKPVATLGIDLLLIVNKSTPNNLVSQIVKSIVRGNSNEWFTLGQINLAKQFALSKNKYNAIPFHDGVIAGFAVE